MRIILSAIPSDYYIVSSPAEKIDYDPWRPTGIKYFSIDYDNSTIKIVEQTNRPGTSVRYALIINDYIAFWSYELSKVEHEISNLEAAARRGEREYRFTRS